MSNKFTRSLISVVSTVGLVASAMTGLLYSAPVSATGTTNASNIVPANGTKLTQGQKFNFQFRITKTSSSSGSVYARLGNTAGAVFTPTTGIAAASGCQVYFEVDTPASSGTRSCTNLFNTTGIDIPGLNQNSTVTVYVGTSTSKTDTGAIVNESSVSGSTNELQVAILSSDTSANIGNLVGAGPENGVATYDVIPDVRLSVKKQRITSASDYNSFSADAAANYTTFVTANPAYAYVFGVNVENSGATTVTGINLTERLDGTAAGYFDNCIVNPGVVSTVFPGINPAANVPATFSNAVPATTTNRSSTAPMSISGGSSSAIARITYLVACRRNTSNLPTSGNAGSNIFEITGFSSPSISEINPTPTLPIQGVAPISGGADLKVTKEVISGATNGSPVNSGTTVQYKVTVSNVSTTSNCSTPTNLVDFIEAFGGVVATTITTNAATLVSPNRCNGATGEFAVNVADVQAAYPNATSIGNTMRVIPVKELAPGQTVTIVYSVVYSNIPSACPAVGPAPRIRNTAAIVDSVAPDTIATGTVLSPSATQNGFFFGAVSFVYWDTTLSTPSITLSPNISLYGDSNQTDNGAYVDISPDVCKPDMRLVSKYRSTPLTGGSSTDALLGENGAAGVEYTIEYQNYGARYTAGGLPKSAAKNVVVSDTLPDGFSFVKVVSPAGATASVSGQTVTITGLPNLSLGDEGVKQVKLTIKTPTDKAKVGLTNIYNVARVSANNEDGVYDANDKASCVDGATGNSVTCAVSSTPGSTNNIGNNSSRAQITLKGGPDLQVVKTVDIGEGQLKADTNMLQYTVKVKNIGTEIANGVQLRDVFDSCTTYDSKVSGPDGTLNSDQRTIDYAIGNLNVDQEVVVVFKSKITSRTNPCDNKISNVATAWLTSGQIDINKANDSSTANSTTFPINNNADLMKTVDQLSAQPGSTLTYTITFKASNADFKGKLEDQLADKVTFVSATPAVTSSANNKLVWEGVSLKKGEQLVATVKVTVKGDASGTVSNSAIATTTDGKITLSNTAVTSIEVAGNSKITGYVYFDANRNGKQEAKERDAMYADYLGGITVVAKYSNGKETRVTTDKTGAFAFDKLVAGKYTIAIDINTVKGSYKNVQLNVAAVGASADGLSKVQEVPVGGTIDLTAAFRLFTGQTSTGAVANGASSLTALVALLSFSFLATLAYGQARKRALSL